jgi:AraC-like DNA-binding protein
MPLPRELANLFRIVMHPASRGVQGIPLLGRYNHSSAQIDLAEHLHEDAIEICFLVKGRQTYSVGGRTHRLKGGDVFITLPRQRHGSAGWPQEKGVLYWLWVAPRGKTLLGLPREQSEALLEALHQIETPHFKGSWNMKEDLDTITLLHAQPPTPLNAFAITNRVGAFLEKVITCARGNPSEQSSRSFACMTEYINANLTEALSVPHLASKAGLSEARFKVWFKQEAGVPPGEYVLRAKVEEAQRRIEKSKNAVITEIAYDLGFSSSQYFATVFKRFTRGKPSDFKKSR